MAFVDEVNFLLVENDTLDVRMVQRAMQRKKITNPLTIAANGLEALACLRGDDGQQRLPRPYLILLDLNMPRMNGLKFLEAIRADDELSDSIVFVLTSSDSDRDITAAYAHQIAGYITKQDIGNDFMSCMDLLAQYCSTIRFPLMRRDLQSRRLDSGAV